MKLRLQQEDGPITSIGDELQTSSVLDRSEYESLTGSDQTDLYRPMASANHMTGNTWYSTECCADLNESYAATVQDAIIRMNHEFAGGVNRPVYHIRPYIDTPTSSWPGLGFSNGEGDVLERVEPDRAVLGRRGGDQRLLRPQPRGAHAGRRRRRTSRSTSATTRLAGGVRDARPEQPPLAGPRPPARRLHVGLPRRGAVPACRTRSSRNHRLAEDGPDYKALIFDQFLYPTSNTARGALTIEAAQKILAYAKAGLPVDLRRLAHGHGRHAGLGRRDAERDRRADPRPAVRVAGRERGGRPGEARAARHRTRRPSRRRRRRCSASAATTRRRRPTTTGSTTRASTPTRAATAVFGDNPSNLYEEPAACRYTAATGINPCMATGDAVDTHVTLEGAGHAVHARRVHAARSRRSPQYTRSGDTVTVRVKLARDATTVIALSDDPQRLGLDRPNAHVTSTTADGAVPGRQLDRHPGRERRHVRHHARAPASTVTHDAPGGAGGDRSHRRGLAPRRRGLAAARTRTGRSARTAR